jgi:hypothetical protein
MVMRSMARSQRHYIYLGVEWWERTISDLQFIRLFPPALAKFGRWKLKPEEKEQLDAVRAILSYSPALQPSVGYGLFVHEVILITHNDAPQSVGLL